MKRKVMSMLVVLTLVFTAIQIPVFAGISEDQTAYVVEEDETWSDKSFEGDVFIPQNVSLTTSKGVTIEGNVYVFGTLNNTGNLTVSGTLNCLNYSSGGFSMSAGDYTYGILKSSGIMHVNTLNVRDDYLSISIPGTHQHKWIKSYVEKEDCLTNWKQHYYCTECNMERSESIPPAGHNFSDWKIKSPTCVQVGEKQRTCSECGYQELIQIPATGKHNWTSWKTIRKATCINMGYADRDCISCGNSERKALPPTNIHTFGKWSTCKKATALKKGQKVRTCKYCLKKQYADIPKLKAKVTLQKKTIKIKKKKSYTLKIKSKTYGDKISKWQSKNKKIATVNSKGKVVGKKKGKTTITLYMKSGAKAICKVTVK